MSYLLILLAVSLAVSALGWIYFIYFFSIGYGFGVAALAIAIAVIFHQSMTLPTILLCAVMYISYSTDGGIFYDALVGIRKQLENN